MNAQSRKPCEREAARIGTLPKLPVFFDLRDKDAVVVGGTEAAAWKAELLAAAGARVSVVAEIVGTEMRGVAEAITARVVERAWRPEDLAGAAIVVADATDKEDAHAIRDAARSAGAPVNVIDRPAFCDFQFGSIVNRAPVVIGISTDGAAPILGQAIRRRIEMLLPRWLGIWADAAKRLRSTVAARLGDPGRRRAFWERFADLAFSAEPHTAPERDLPSRDLIDIVDRLSSAASDTGHVTLVGAGPGDADYLTIKAVRALQSADVILFDDLVSDEVLELARREAKRMMVGKRGGRESCRQEDINALMVKLARQGKRVVRLKSGDPMIFGRAGEEIAELEQAGIPVDVVPGITAATAMAARLKVSLTHRDHAQSVSFVTGHSCKGCLPDALPIEDLVGAGKTAVIYMGGRTAGELADRLIERGIEPALPAVAVRSVARPDEQVWSGALRDLKDASRSVLGDGPVLIAIGDVLRTHAAAARHMAGGEKQSLAS
jgi:uroporphyrin-III C-methyltransferase / precorrin-2 dehydrogenase / sirohydrochlorin ferrochelatase